MSEKEWDGVTEEMKSVNLLEMMQVWNKWGRKIKGADI